MKIHTEDVEIIPTMGDGNCLFYAIREDKRTEHNEDIKGLMLEFRQNIADMINLDVINCSLVEIFILQKKL